ncbi:MAG: NADH-quinone oxidoreductase subunit N [Planctomycetota bacterium]|nr:NADH-quinone oxidoreductase subunit N [Planctomycetota bacterium]
MNIDLNLHLMLPELIVLAAALAAIVTELLLPAGRRALPVAWTCFAGLAVAFVMLLVGDYDGRAMRVPGDAAEGAPLITGWISDGFSVFCRQVIAFGGMLLVLLSMPYTRRMDKGHGEFYGLLLFALFGVMLSSGVSDLLSFFVCLELVTISAFIMAAFKRNDLRSAEAGLKYLVIGAASTALLLLGIGFIYGATGTLSFDLITQQLGDIEALGPKAWLLWIGLALLLSGLLFKIGGVPFQVWMPDVYQGAPSPVTAFLSTASKGVGLILFIRIGTALLAPAEAAAGGVSLVAVLGTVAVVTLLFGTLAAIPQKNIKRLLAYSSIGHAGYLLMGITALVKASEAGQVDAASALLFYLLAYVVTNATAFAVIVLVSGSLGTHEHPAYSGLAQRSPFVALAMCLALLSLAGVPPMSGFFGKFLILRAAVNEGMVFIAFVGAVGVVISLYFYLLWIKEMYFKAPREGAEAVKAGSLKPVPVSVPALVVLVIGIIGMLGMGIAMGPFYDWAAQAAESLAAAP